MLPTELPGNTECVWVCEMARNAYFCPNKLCEFKGMGLNFRKCRNLTYRVFHLTCGSAADVQRRDDGEKWEVWKDEILIVMPVLRVYGIIV